MEDNEQSGPVYRSPVVAVLVAIVAFVGALAIIATPFEYLGVSARWTIRCLVLIMTIGVAVIVGIYQHKLNALRWHDEAVGVLSGQRHDSIMRLHREQNEAEAKLKELEGIRARLLEEIEERKRLERIDMEIYGISEEAVKELVHVVAKLYAMRNSPGGMTKASVGEVQDQALVAILTYLRQVIPADRERAKKRVPLDQGLWDETMLRQFFGDDHKDIIGALRQLDRHKNKVFADVVFSLPPDVERYFSRLTIVDPGQQPAASQPG